MTIFYLIDAFTASPFGGNQAAVVLSEEPIADKVKQQLAAEFNVSETAFPEPRDGSFKTATRFGLRWFTPTVEIDLCGHATLATAHALLHGMGNTTSRLCFDTIHHGELFVSRGENGLLAMDFPQYKLVSINTGSNPFDHLFPELPAPSFLPELTKCLIPDHLKVEGFVHSPVGKKLLIVLDPSTTREQFRGLLTNYRRMLEIQPTTEWLHGIIVTFSPKDAIKQGFQEAYDYVCRFFAPWSGVDEDPATGSAQCGLGPLWRAVLKKDVLNGYQAYSGRGAEFSLSFPSDGRVLIQGNAVTVVGGTLHM